MNLTKFLNQVDTQLKEISRDKIIQFVHEIARTLPEQDRDNFLLKLNEAQKEKKTGKTNKTALQYQEIKESLERIVKNELCIIGNLNEEYDDWYDSCKDEFIFQDPDGVTEIVNNACKFVHQCVDCEEYQNGYQIVKILMDLQIAVEGDYPDYGEDAIGIDGLEDCEFDTYDLQHFAIDAAYIAYCVNKISDRAEVLFTIFEKFSAFDVTLELIMQNGEELPDQEAFLPVWIAYLGNQETALSSALLKEALELTNNESIQLENIRKYSEQHPSLWIQYLQNYANKKQATELLAIGKEALEAIDVKYIVRSQVALLASEFALKAKNQQEAEACWLEAYRSDTTVVNYLRLFMESTDFSKFQEETKTIYHQNCTGNNKQSFYTANKELNENHLSEEMRDMLAFLCGEFENVKMHAMNIEEALGWSFTFMKCGLAAFLLLLLESEQMQKGGSFMCDIIMEHIKFSSEEYKKGTLRTDINDSKSWFWSCFSQWKKGIVLSAEEKQQYLDWIDGLIAKRVEGIMEANRRNYYDECAGYVAALGEVYEAGGYYGRKQGVMLDYKNKYPRRRAFHDELRKMGMTDR